MKRSPDNSPEGKVKEEILVDPLLANRHYETIDESRQKNSAHHHNKPPSHCENPSVAALKPSSATNQCSRITPVKIDDSNSSSGTSDMSDYIDSVSSSHIAGSSTNMVNNVVPLNISASPKKSTFMKPRTGNEYFKIDRNRFRNE